MQSQHIKTKIKWWSGQNYKIIELASGKNAKAITLDDIKF